MRSRDYLWAERYPSITFRLDRLEQTSKQTADIVGRITLRGVTRPIAFQARCSATARPRTIPAASRPASTSSGSIDRTEFGSTGGAARGGRGAAGAHPPGDALALRPMRATDTAASWGWVARLLHWTMAALILFQLGLGLWMTSLRPISSSASA